MADQTADRAIAARHSSDRRRCKRERRAGQMIGEMEKAKGARGNPGGQGAAIVPLHDASTQTLADLGISHDQSSRWQKLAAIDNQRTRSHAVTRTDHGGSGGCRVGAGGCLFITGELTHSSSGPSVESVEQPWGYESVSPPCQDDFPASNSRLFNIDV